MRIYIPTYGRAETETQYTLNALPKELLSNTVLVVQERERDRYEYSKARYIVLPSNIKTIAPTRQWIMQVHNVQRHGPKLVMLDDDLPFYVRRKDDATKFKRAMPSDLIKLFKLIEQRLERYVHVGVLMHEGAHRALAIDTYATHMCRVLAYDVPTFRRLNIDIGRAAVGQDKDATLQLISKGYANCSINSYAQGQTRGTNAPGGCASYRTVALLEKSLKQIERWHAPFVKLEYRAHIGKEWGGSRDKPVMLPYIRVQWKKAYAYGRSLRLASGDTSKFI